MDDNNNVSTWCWMLRSEEATPQSIRQFFQFVRCDRLYVAVHCDLHFATLLSSLYIAAARFAPALDLRVLINKLPPKDALAFRGNYNGDIWAEQRKREGRFGKTAVAGCFDRLHNGHKILLSRAALISSTQVLVGVSDGELNAKKALRDLIQPASVRMNVVREFLESITNVPVDVRCITHPHLPALTTQDIQAMVVSVETRRQGEHFNILRVFCHLDPLFIDVVPTLTVDTADGCKISSSSRRAALLGRLLRPINRESNLIPYTIGLTGAPTSGKSMIGVDLRMMGYTVLECERDFERVRVSLNEKSSNDVIFIISRSLLSSSLHSELHETWTVIAGVQKLERRRRGKEEEEDQTTSSARIAVSNVVLSTNGSRDETLRQLQQALQLMEKRRKERNEE